MPKIGAFLISIALCMVAFARPQEFKMSENKKYVEIKTRELEGLQLTTDCFKSAKPKCDSLAATTKKIAMSDSKIPLTGHPAARLCLDYDGLNRILISKDKDQYDFCLFKDGSMINAWDLYYHFNQKPMIQ